MIGHYYDRLAAGAPVQHVLRWYQTQEAARYREVQAPLMPDRTRALERRALSLLGGRGGGA